MPVFNEGAALVNTLSSVREAVDGFSRVCVYVVDDGSKPALDPQSFPACTPRFGIVLARHMVNLGQGAALETARILALTDPRHDIFVTMDADGQHAASDLVRFRDALSDGHDVVFGNRFLAHSSVPFGRRLVLLAAREFERRLTGLELKDAHNGYRGFSRHALESISIHQNRMAHATEIKQSIARTADLKVSEIPVSIRYSSQTLAKGQSSLGALQILTDLFSDFLFRKRS
jgi:polyprenyl-phospho-N-acetylgalactosaminyl synthase